MNRMSFITKGVNQKTEDAKRCGKPFVDEMRVFKYFEHYKRVYKEEDIDRVGCYQLKIDSVDWVVTWGEKILSQGIKKYPYYVWYPIIWSSYQKADNWLKDGSIGDLQEELGNLQIGFVREQLQLVY